MKISKDTIFAISNEFIWGFDNNEMNLGEELPGGKDSIEPNKLTPENIDKVYDYICNNTDEIFISFDKDFAEGNAGVYYGIHFKVPKNKEITLDYIYNKIYKAKNPIKIDTYEIFKKFGQKYKVPADPTTFGFSAYILFGGGNQLINKVTKILTDKGISFKERMSPGGWCYNWIISKRKENLDLIKENNAYIKSYNEWKS